MLVHLFFVFLVFSISNNYNTNIYPKCHKYYINDFNILHLVKIGMSTVLSSYFALHRSGLFISFKNYSLKK